MSRTKRVLGRTGLVLVSALLSIGVAEAAYRASLATGDAPDGGDDGWRERYRHMNETLYRRSEDEVLVYEPVPGASVEMEYGAAGFNSRALRDDREPARDPDPETTRVAILGDSLVFSEFLALHDSIPRRAEEALGDGYEVLNLGVTGYDTEQEAAWYERAARPLSPSVVVLVFCMNDMMIMSGPFERFANERDRARKDAQEALMEREAPVRRETIDRVLEQREEAATVKLFARLSAMLERWRFDRRYVDEYTTAFAQPDARERTRAALERLGGAIREDGAAPILVISPVLEAWDDYHWSEIHAFVTEAAEAAGFSVVDPLEGWREEHTADEMRISGDNLHYDGSGARVMGQTIADAVRSLR